MIGRIHRREDGLRPHNGKLVSLKSAAPATKSIGVTYLMLDRIDEVVAALQRDDGAFDLYSISLRRFGDDAN